MSAMDLTKPAGNYNIAFNDATQYQIEAITEKLNISLCNQTRLTPLVNLVF